MALDTRGFVDGALQGFQVAEGHYQRKKDNERQDRLDERDEQRYQYEKTRLSQLDEQDRKRYESEAKRADADLTLRQIEAKQRGTLLDAQISTQKSNKELHDFELGQKKKLAFMQENMPVIQSNLKGFMETGQLDPIFDHEYLKDSAYDPRRYTPRVMQAAFDIEATMPKVLDGTISYRDPAFTKSLGVLLERNVKQGIGDVDPESGKKIANKEYLRHDFIADIDPNREGDQPGVVIGLKVTYEDGTSQVAPVTEGRKPGASEAAKVIPLDALMKDVTGQLSMAKQFFTSEHYANLFADKGGKNGDEVGKQWREAVTDLEKDRTKAINELMDPTPEQIEALNVRFNERRTVIDQIYGKLGVESGGANNQAMNAASQWAGNDPQKQQFINELNPKDIANVPPEQLESEFQRAVKMREVAVRERTYQTLLAKLKDETNYAKAKQEVEQAGLTPDQQRSILGQISQNQYDAATPDFIKEIPEKVSQGLSDLADGLKPIQPQTLRNIPRPF
ncbi:ATPase [Vibrio navarrensis]|uniref:ATPase n=1 Tax=Vibrio navarrensis TaxID=29495 RepID=A0AAJ4I8P1_9VIBR|nr:ATPase [Vibrio navarrensis]